MTQRECNFLLWRLHLTKEKGCYTYRHTYSVYIEKQSFMGPGLFDSILYCILSCYEKKGRISYSKSLGPFATLSLSHLPKNSKSPTQSKRSSDKSTQRHTLPKTSSDKATQRHTRPKTSSDKATQRHTQPKTSSDKAPQRHTQPKTSSDKAPQRHT